MILLYAHTVHTHTHAHTTRTLYTDTQHYTHYTRLTHSLYALPCNAMYTFYSLWDVNILKL